MMLPPILIKKSGGFVKKDMNGKEQFLIEQTDAVVHTAAENCLITKSPTLAKEWHPSKNGKITPYDVTPKSGKKYWWICPKEHEWEAAVSNRNRSRDKGCPYCSGRRVCNDNCLSTVNPILASEWHLFKNKNLTPKYVTSRSGIKVWWRCKNEHEWIARIADRTAGHNCPYCSGKRVNNDNSLKTLKPELAQQWHPTRNKKLTPDDVTVSSHKRIWWICNKGHEWQSVVSHRSRGKGCPYCAGRKATKDNNLKTLNPKIASLWHPTKNGKLTADKVTPGSHKKVWWKCKKDHEWEGNISDRVKSVGCPFCNSKTSRIELRILSELQYFFPEINHRYKIKNIECDIFIPQYKVAIEYDGFYWHKEKLEKDKKKTEFLTKDGILLIRIRENGLERISELDILISSKTTEFTIVSNLLKKLLHAIPLSHEMITKIKVYQQKKSFINAKHYRQLLNMLPSPLPGKSLSDKYPDLAKEWHYKKNELLLPEDVSPASHLNVWWICSKGHEWKSTLKNRTLGKNNCPYCSGMKLSYERSLTASGSVLLKEWNFTRNGELKPEHVSFKSNKKVWWICSKGHEWQNTVSKRTIRGDGCPYCSGRRVSKDNCLETINPELVAQWHPTKNGTLSPQDVTPGSSKEVWWLCNNGHVWKRKISYRNKGIGCPYCSGRLATIENCLASHYPDLAKEWHPSKNSNLTAWDITPKSDKKVWWLCLNGHEWSTSVNNRANGKKCPICKKSKIKYSKNLE